MRLRPRITSPCPLRFGALPQAGMDFCTRCTRRVHNLDAMDEAARTAFFAGCNGAKVCVAYTVRRAPALLAAGAGLALLAGCAATPEAAGVAGPAAGDPLDAQEYVLLGGVEGEPALVDVDDPAVALPALPQGQEDLWLDDAGSDAIASFVAAPGTAQEPGPVAGS